MNAGRLLRALTDGEVRFIVVGGIAAVAQGVPFVTFDVDVVHERSPENVQRLLAVLSGIDAVYVRPSGSPPIVPRADLLLGDGHHILTSVYGRLDVLVASPRGSGDVFAMMLGVLLGRPDLRRVDRLHGTRATMSFDRPVPFQVDGDVVGDVTEVAVEVQPGAALLVRRTVP